MSSFRISMVVIFGCTMLAGPSFASDHFDALKKGATCFDGTIVHAETKTGTQWLRDRLAELNLDGAITWLAPSSYSKPENDDYAGPKPTPKPVKHISEIMWNYDWLWTTRCTKPDVGTYYCGDAHSYGVTCWDKKLTPPEPEMCMAYVEAKLSCGKEAGNFADFTTTCTYIPATTEMVPCS